MPFAHVIVCVPINGARRFKLCTAVSSAISRVTGKPESYCMVACSEAAIVMAGKEGQAAFVDLRAIGGINDKINRQLSDTICAAISSVINIPAERIYLTFTDVAAANWGHNGSTFG